MKTRSWPSAGSWFSRRILSRSSLWLSSPLWASSRRRTNPPCAIAECAAVELPDAPLQPMVITLRARLRTIGTLTRTVSLDRDGTILVAGGEHACGSNVVPPPRGQRRVERGEAGGRIPLRLDPVACHRSKGDILAVGLSAHTEVYSINRDSLVRTL